jgi:hypothetical protein
MMAVVGVVGVAAAAGGELQEGTMEKIEGDVRV